MHQPQASFAANPAPLARREFLVSTGSAAAWVLLGDGQTAFAADTAGPHQATGVRIGEVTSDSAIVWTRLTKHLERNNDGVLIPGRRKDKTNDKPPVPDVPVDGLEGACPAASGFVRLRYGTNTELNDAKVTPWQKVAAVHDGIHHFQLTGLQPATAYHFVSESAAAENGPSAAQVRGQFRTAPRAADIAPVKFCVMTCQGYPDRGHPDGHGIYPSMQALDADFTCLTGDLVYYDNDRPQATTVRLARFHWERMFSLPRLREFNRSTGTYWLKDDHDTLTNDTWPGKTVGDLTFAQGQRIFRQQAPLGDGPAYRTFRWGRDVQVWLTEGRDFRSPNTTPDGAAKTILGAEQKAWLQDTLAKSDATWKILVSPTPYVGPDRPSGKNDNHSNAGFTHEGDELRRWFAEHLKDSFLIICGDRHWQYHSVHPATGLHEFSVGAASNEHAGGSPGEDKNYHRFHRVGGGFLTVQADRKDGQCLLTCRHHDVSGKVVYEYERKRPAG